MIFLKSLTLILFFCLSSSSWAIKAEFYADKSEEQVSTCKLIFQVWNAQEKKIENGFCTSSFIGNKSFISADHCHDSIKQSQADLSKKLISKSPHFICPNSEQTYQVSESFSQSGSGHAQEKDHAIIKVGEKVSAPAINLPDSAEEIEELLKDPSKCFINGYGLDNDEKYGTLRAANILSLDRDPLTLDKSNKEVVRIRKNYADHGDSGGPLYCQTKNGPVLVGVIRGGILGMRHSDIELITDDLNWVYYHKNGTNTSNEKYAEFMSTEFRCHSLEECYLKLEEQAKLTAEMKEIIDHMKKEVGVIKAELKLGNDLAQAEISILWEKIVSEYQKQDCFEILFPKDE